MRIFRIGNRITADLPDEFFFQCIKKLRRNLLSNGSLIDIDADLSAVADFEKRDFSRSITDIGILSHNAPVSGFTAEFERNGRQMLCSLLHDMHADTRRTRIENLIEAFRKA